MNPHQLLTHFDRLANDPQAIPHLRRFILDLAVRGKLTQQSPNDEPASELLKRIWTESNHQTKRKKDHKKSTYILFDIPNGWIASTLHEISIHINYGFTASANSSISEVRLLRITDIQNNSVNWDSVPGCEIPSSDIDKYKLVKGDILIARTGGTVGKTFLVEDIWVTSVFASYLIRVRPSSYLLDKYIKLFCESTIYWEQLQDGTRGGAQPNVNGETLGNMLIPIPPLAEQHRIVAKVDELTALCDRLEAAQKEREATRDRLATAALSRLIPAQSRGENAAQADSIKPSDSSSDSQNDARFYLNLLPRLATRPEHVKEIRQTILNLAIRGKIVGQDSCDEPASELLKQINIEKTTRLRKRENSSVADVSSISKPFSIPENWQWISFGEVILNSDSGWSPKTESYAKSDDKWGVIKVSAVSWDRFLPDENKQLPSDVTPPTSAIINEGDFLISRANTSELIAKSVVVDCKVDKLILSDKIVRLEISNNVNKRFLYFVNNYALYARRYYASEASGTSLSMKNVSRGVIYALPIPIPPLAEQHRIVAKVDELMALCDNLEAELSTTRTESERLLEAVLHEALAA